MLQVGDILVSAWGYPKVRVEFFQVVDVVSNRSVAVARVHGNPRWTSAMNCTVVGNTVPIKDSFVTLGERHVLRATGLTARLNAYASASMWDGQSVGFGENVSAELIDQDRRFDSRPPDRIRHGIPQTK